MASVQQYQDPYNGWRAISGNVTAHEIMTDTSGRWNCTFYMPRFRIYERAW